MNHQAIYRKVSILSTVVLLVLITFLQTSCSSSGGADRKAKMVVSVPEQRMLLISKGKPVKIYPISTSKFGLGSKPGSSRTPIGKLGVARKIGGGAPSGSVFKSRRRTGEVLRPNAPGRDPIVTRIMWLYGKEPQNANTYRRLIYIHGTPEEYKIGRPASYGCIRMTSNDVADLYKRVGVGAEVEVIPVPLPPVWEDGTKLKQIPVSRPR